MENSKLILGLVGEMASGKGTMAKYLEDKYQAKKLRASAYLRKTLDMLGLEISRQNMITLSGLLRQGFGEDILSRALMNDINKDPASMIILDGIRRKEELEGLKSLPEFKLVYITAGGEARFKRLTTRGENDDDAKKTLDEFMRESAAETERTIAPLKDMSDHVLDNSGTVEEFLSSIDELINRINK